jgi:endonuclease YncB( thermonuclease family)
MVVRTLVLILVGVAGALPVGAQSDADELVLAGRVTKVIDGDTIDVELESGPIRVRLDSIDAPERAQPWGREATEALSRFLRNGTAKVELQVSEQDRYERMVATVYLDGVNVNAWLVADGHAWAYSTYLNDKSIPAVEAEARRLRRGLWRANDPVAPWKWRKAHREAFEDFDDRDDFELPGPDAAAENRQCGAKRYCGDMATCDEARFFMNVCGLSRLDGDRDGVPCEELCR